LKNDYRNVNVKDRKLVAVGTSGVHSAEESGELEMSDHDRFKEW
jgi:hypothetical protein